MGLPARTAFPVLKEIDYITGLAANSSSLLLFRDSQIAA